MMEFSFDIFQIYGQYRAVTSRLIAPVREGDSPDDQLNRVRLSKEALSQMLKVLDPKLTERVSVFDELCKLKSKLECFNADFFEFSQFYDFVFFMCRENGQKGITVNRAVTAWRLVLPGSFRLLNEWCDFVEKHQQHNISEDTWRQILAFSRSVNENLEGYDPQGAWPVLIDDFVDYMYRIRGFSHSPAFVCSCADSESRPCNDNISVTKRKSEEDSTMSPIDDSTTIAKRRKLHVPTFGSNPNSPQDDDDLERIKPPGCTMTTICAIEGCLSRGFAGLLTGSSCIHFDSARRLSYT